LAFTEIYQQAAFVQR